MTGRYHSVIKQRKWLLSRQAPFSRRRCIVQSDVHVASWRRLRGFHWCWACRHRGIHPTSSCSGQQVEEPRRGITNRFWGPEHGVGFIDHFLRKDLVVWKYDMITKPFLDHSWSLEPMILCSWLIFVVKDFWYSIFYSERG